MDNCRRAQRHCIIGYVRTMGNSKYESLRFEAVFIDPQDTEPRVKSLTRNSELGSGSGWTGDTPASLSKHRFNDFFFSIRVQPS
jgi:hypothetical protein